MSILEKLAKSPKARAQWAKRNKDLADYLELEAKSYSDASEDTGSLWEKDVDKAYKKLHKDDKRSLRREGPFKEDVLGIIYPER